MWEKTLINLDEAIERVLGHKEMYQRWLNEFFVPETLNNAYTAFGDKDYDAAHKAVHKLKGTAGNLAITPLAEEATFLDEKIKSKVPFEQMKDDFEKIVLTFNKAGDMFKQNQNCILEYEYME